MLSRRPSIVALAAPAAAPSKEIEVARTSLPR
jgi:hypothetical protein